LTINKYLAVISTWAAKPATKRYILSSSGEKGINGKGMQEIASHRSTEKEHSSEEEALHEDMSGMWSEKCSNCKEMQEMQKFKLAVEEAGEVSLVCSL